QTLAEAYAIVKASGIEPRMLIEALKNHGVRSGVADAKLAKMVNRDYEPHFSLKHMFKDVQLGIHIANSMEIDLPATTATAGVMYGGLTRGWADEDFAVLARYYQKESEPAFLNVPPPKTEEKAAPAPEEKPRESTPSELRDMGIKVPEEPKPESRVETKTESKAEPAKAEPVAAEAAKPEPAKTDVSSEKSKSETVGSANGNPDEAASPHTPFVRIRRWFGTGSTN
ncbi:MAG: NAD-binding protein, partial [Chthoniobacteraceae bacterium]